MDETKGGILRRILTKIGDTELLEKLAVLSPSDAHSLMMAWFQRQSDALQPSALLKRYRANPFVKPGALDPIAYLQQELEMLAFARERGIAPVLLSPAALFSGCATVAPVSQNKVLSAARGTEVLSDPTNMLAIYLAEKLNSGEWDNSRQSLHLCAAHRAVRAQAFSGPNSYAHFGLFGMVSSGRDSGSYRCEWELLAHQLRFYDDYLRAALGADIFILLRSRKGYTNTRGFLERTYEYIQSSFPGVPMEMDWAESDNEYYRGLNFKIRMRLKDQTIEIGDGGFVDWTQKLLGNKKERLLISAIGLDRLMLLKSNQSHT